jgi:hypothetical protein
MLFDIKYKKYQKICHLPNSQSISSDDNWLSDSSQFDNKLVIILEKFDDENTTMYDDKIHARSIDSMHLYARHPARTYVKALHAKVKHKIPKNIRIVGGNLYAKHVVSYDLLPDYFIAYCAFRYDNSVGISTCLGWSETIDICNNVGLKIAQPIYIGHWNSKDKNKWWPFQSMYSSTDLAEGYIVRNVNSFPESEFDQNYGKFVRKNFCLDDEHWMQKPVVPNKLAGKGDI